MTPEQNKNLILNNLDKYLIDGKGNFVSLEKDYNDSEYIIWKNKVADYEEVKEKVAQEIVKDKEKRSKVIGKIISDNLMEMILLEKENWEIVYATLPSGDREPMFYKYRPTGEEISADTYQIFNFGQNYILLGELGYREKYLKDYDQWGHYRTKEWWQRRNYKKKNKTKKQPPINPPPIPPQENQKYEESKKKAEEERQKQREPFQKKIEEIKVALNEELPLTDSDLSPQYQDWEEQINNSTDLQQVTKFQEKLLVNIQTRREEKKSTSSLLKKFASIPNFNQENLEALIEPVKNNPNFLQQLQAKQIPSLTALIIEQSPQEIIITVKRFEYDQEKEKEKKIRAYYHLKPSEVLTDNQINNYLYREAIGQITSQTESPNNENNGLLIPLIIGGGVLLILFGTVAVIRIRLKRK